jgi:hypothetical protein
VAIGEEGEDVSDLRPQKETVAPAAAAEPISVPVTSQPVVRSSMASPRRRIRRAA